MSEKTTIAKLAALGLLQQHYESAMRAELRQTNELTEASSSLTAGLRENHAGTTRDFMRRQTQLLEITAKIESGAEESLSESTWLCRELRTLVIHRLYESPYFMSVDKSVPNNTIVDLKTLVTGLMLFGDMFYFDYREDNWTPQK